MISIPVWLFYVMCCLSGITIGLGISVLVEKLLK